MLRVNKPIFEEKKKRKESCRPNIIAAAVQFTSSLHIPDYLVTVKENVVEI